MTTSALEVAESEQLLTSKRPSTKRWSTCQLILICTTIVILAVFVSNLDRIIDELKDDSSSDDSSDDMPRSFGHEMYDYFEISSEDNIKDFNWGSWGGYPISIREQIDDLHSYILKNLMYYQMLERPGLQQETLQLLAEYIGIKDYLDLVFVDNASHGINAIIRSLSQYLYSNRCYEIYSEYNTTENIENKTCKVLQFNTAYPMVTETLWYINNNIASQQNQILMFNLTDEMLNNTDLLIQELNQFILDETSDGNTLIYMAIISEITAFPASVLNIQRIVDEALRPNKILSAIDAAHSLGQIKINISAMNPDFYVATGYKWFYAPRGSGILYVRNTQNDPQFNGNIQDLIWPTVISTGTQNAAFSGRFRFSGAKDYTPWIGMKYALEWRRNLTVIDDDDDDRNGDDKIIEYNHNLAIQGGKLVASIWNTSLLFENEQYIGSMVNVVFITQNPIEVQAIFGTLFAGDIMYWYRAQQSLDGTYVARICAQIFYDLYDFEQFANVIKDTLEEIRSQ